MANILVVAAHPDDEILGCGGTIARHVADGDKVNVVILAEGVTSRPGQTGNAPALAELRDAARAANAILGVEAVSFEGFPDNRLDGLVRLEVIRRIEAHVERCGPQFIYTHHVGDVNIDHQIAHHAVVTACRPQPAHPVHTLLFFETPSSTEWQTPGSAPPFLPNWFIDISITLERKLQALAAYRSEMRPWPHPRSFEAVSHLAHLRGAASGLDSAEAFMLGRRINFP
jgi:LmbE family N-acetylglucosaminyl deacetylase